MWIVCQSALLAACRRSFEMHAHVRPCYALNESGRLSLTLLSASSCGSNLCMPVCEYGVTLAHATWVFLMVASCTSPLGLHVQTCELLLLPARAVLLIIAYASCFMCATCGASNSAKRFAVCCMCLGLTWGFLQLPVGAEVSSQ